MSYQTRLFCLLALAAPAIGACEAPLPPPAVPDGYVHVTQRSGTIACDGRPVSVDSMHADIVVRNDCRRVRLAGSHDDVTVYIQPGGSIEITGHHNDLVWRQTGPGPRPYLIGGGETNTFHRNSRDSAEANPDWWQGP